MGDESDESSGWEELNEWLKWVRQEKLKVIYVTMGSMQKVLDFQITALYDGLDKVPGTAIAWSLKQDQQKLLPREGQGLPQKFFVNTWFPQAEALNLPEVAVVITHCGWGGLNEAILAGKPIVAIPFRADQPTNAKIVEEREWCGRRAARWDAMALARRALDRTSLDLCPNPAVCYTTTSACLRVRELTLGCDQCVRRQAWIGALN
jgi:UDP:flavonoid glycosyltransferase YjiC (YdhE family)